MSDGTATPSTPAPASGDAAVLGGGAAPAVLGGNPVAAAPAATPAAPRANEGKPNEPLPGQAAADAKAAADKAEADKAEAAKKAAADTQAAKDAANAAKQAEDKSWAEWKPKAPEGRQLDEASLKEFVPLARELGLKPEQAQKLVDFQAKALKGMETAAIANLEANAQRELGQLKAERGASFDADMRVANKAIDRFGTPELKAYIKSTGQYANPQLFKMFHAIGVAMADDKLADGAGLGGPAKGTGVNAAKMYPNTKFRNA